MRLPDNYIAAMAARTPHPVWINLEHLSAEAWVDGCHGLPSPHPSLPLVKHFFFPGFTAATGGLLIERGLAQAREAFQADADARRPLLASARHCARCGCGAARIAFLLRQCRAARARRRVVGGTRARYVHSAGGQRACASCRPSWAAASSPGRAWCGADLTIAAIPFLDIDQYDRLLWACDINFVRGEDSFVRAQLAARPLVWQAYVQKDDAHMAKLAAFLDRYAGGLDAATAAAVRAIHERVEPPIRRMRGNAGRRWCPGVPPPARMRGPGPGSSPRRQSRDQAGRILPGSARIAAF